MTIKTSNKVLVRTESPKNNKLIKHATDKSTTLKKLVSQLLNCCDE